MTLDQNFSLGSDILLDVQDIHKKYQSGEAELEVLKGVSLKVKKAEAICLLGASGAGKSTLLQILGTLDRPTSGQVLYQGESLFSLDDQKLAEFRNQKMGFVFQFHHLIQELTALENILLPSLIANDNEAESIQEANRWLDYMGLSNRAHHFPSQLSGGELQRVAIARALVKKPEILLADEPTGNLDSENAKRIQELFFDLQKKLGLTLIVVTHDLQFASQFPRVFKVVNGRFA